MNVLSRYIFSSILRTQLAVFFVLMLIFLSQGFIKLITNVSRGKVPVDMVSQLLMLSVPTMSNFMLPLSLFLAILFCIGSLCSQSEMVVMRSVGLSKGCLLAIVFVLCLFSGVLNAFCTLHLAPMCESLSAAKLEQAKSDPTMFSIDSGRFLKLNNNVLYIENMEDKGNKNLQQIYIINIGRGQEPSNVVTSNEGKVNLDKDGMMWVSLVNGTRYESQNKNKEYSISRFDEYNALISDMRAEGVNEKSRSKTNIELLNSGELEDIGELQWRIVQPFSILVLCLMVVPLSMVNPRQGRFAKFLPAILIYISYYMFSLGVKTSIGKGIFPVIPGVFIVPILYCLIFTVPFNITDTEWFNKLRAKRGIKRV